MRNKDKKEEKRTYVEQLKMTIQQETKSKNIYNTTTLRVYNIINIHITNYKFINN